MELLKIETDKIREVIGTGGKVIREIVEKSGAKVDIDDTGNIKVSSNQKDNISNALKMIHDIIDEPENGKIYSGKVVKVVEFGAFVNFLGKKDGLVHISALSHERVEKVTDVVNEGDEVKVKVIGFDKRGKVRLSIKDVDQYFEDSILVIMKSLNLYHLQVKKSCLIEGGKGVAVSNGLTAGSWAPGGVGTFSGVNADNYRADGSVIRQIYHGKQE